MTIANITATNGKNGLIYVSGTQIYGANAWDISVPHDTTEYAVMGDSWKSNFSGLIGWAGTITALADQASQVLFTAAAYDGTVALLIYPDSTDITTYYTGNAIFGFGASADMTSAIGRTADFTGDGALAATGFS